MRIYLKSPIDLKTKAKYRDFKEYELCLLKTDNGITICRIIRDEDTISEMFVYIDADLIRCEILKSTIMNVYKITFVGREM